MFSSGDQDAIKDEEIKNSLKIADEILQSNEIRIKSKTNKIFKYVFSTISACLTIWQEMLFNSVIQKH